MHGPLGVFLVLVGQRVNELFCPGDAGLLAIGEAAAKVAEAEVADLELDENKVEEEQLRRVVVGVYKRSELFICCVVDQGVVVGELSKG